MAQGAAANKKHKEHIRLSTGDRLFVILELYAAGVYNAAGALSSGIS